jgi:ESF2/ABP1 family protein
MSSSTKRRRDSEDEEDPSHVSAGSAELSSEELARNGSDLEQPIAGPSRSKTSTKKTTKKKKADKSPGIVYISRLPPGMTPQKVRHLMARWGDLGKVYAQARDSDSPPTYYTSPTLMYFSTDRI